MNSDTYKGLAKDNDPRYKRNTWRILFGTNINKIFSKKVGEVKNGKSN